MHLFKIYKPYVGRSFLFFFNKNMLSIKTTVLKTALMESGYHLSDRINYGI
jgi:hypothetical protein